MTNVLLTYESIEPTNQEFYKLLSSASECGGFALRQKRCMEITREDIDWCDAIVSVRSTCDYERHLVNYAKKLGKFWVTMLDDDFLSLGNDYGRDGQGYRDERKRCLKEVLNHTDSLLAVNKLLAEKYTEIGCIPRYALTNTPIDGTKMISPQKRDGKIKIAFYVNDGTKNMFDLFLKPIFPKLCELFGENIALYFMTVHPDMSTFEDKMEIHYVPHLSFSDFLEYISNAHFDIGLAPLDNKGFSQYKYFNKYIEYTRAGIAGIYSDCPLYKQVVIDGYNGILCDNTTDGWLYALESLITNSEKRLKIAQNAQTYAREHFNKDAVAKKLLQDIPELSSYKAPKSQASNVKIMFFRISYYGFRFRGWVYTAYSCIRSGNICALFKRIRERIHCGGEQQ